MKLQPEFPKLFQASFPSGNRSFHQLTGDSSSASKISASVYTASIRSLSYNAEQTTEKPWTLGKRKVSLADILNIRQSEWSIFQINFNKFS